MNPIRFEGDDILKGCYKELTERKAEIFQSALPYFTQEGRTRYHERPQDITINDIVESERINYFEKLKKEIYRGELGSFVATYNPDNDENFRINDYLKPNKIIEVLKLINSSSAKIAEARISAIRKNVPLVEASEINIKIAPIIVNDTDLIAKNETHSTEAKQEFYERIPLSSKRLQQVNELTNTEVLRYIDEMHHLLIYILTSAKKQNRPLSELTEKEMGALEKEFQLKEAEEKENRAIKAGLELINESPTTKKSRVRKKKNGKAALKQEERVTNSKPPSTPSTKKSQNNNRPPLKLTPSLPSIISELNQRAPKYTYSPHSRIIRWRTKRDSEIENFVDFDEQDQPIFPYQGKSPEFLRSMKHRHNFSGIERILSNPLLFKKYSFPNDFIDKHGDPRKGVAIHVKKIVGDHEEFGYVFVGFGEDNVIYHAFFKPFGNNILQFDQFNKTIHGYSDKNEDTSSWNLTTDYSFSCLNENVLKMEIGKDPNDRVTYHFYCLE